MNSAVKNSIVTHWEGEFSHNLISSCLAGLFLAFSELLMDQSYTQLLGRSLLGQTVVPISSWTSQCCSQLTANNTHVFCQV